MILLTKEINDLLDTMKLPELTIQRTNDGFLQLVGRECGKSILVFSSMPISKKLTVAEREILRDDYIMSVVSKYNKKLLDLISTLKDTKPRESTEMIMDVLKKTHKLDVNLNRAYSYTDELAKLEAITIIHPKNGILFRYNIKNNTYDVTLSQSNEENFDNITNRIKEYTSKKKIIEKTIKDLIASSSKEDDQQKKITSLQKELIAKCII